MSEETPISSRARAVAGALRWALVVAVALIAALGVAIGAGVIGERAHVTYVCPMHAQVVNDGPGSCPICGMDLVPASTLDAGTPAPHAARDGGASDTTRPTVHVGAAQARNLGFATVAARRSALSRHLRAPARVDADATASAVVEVRLPGWLGDLAVRSVGERVRRGQALATLNSPSLFEAETTLAAARDAAQTLGPGGPALLDGARARLAALGVPAPEVERVARGGAPTTRLAVPAPRGGVVVALAASEGAWVTPGTALLTIADPARVAIVAELAEAEAESLATGAPVTITLLAAPTRALPGRVTLRAPTIDPARRTRAVRIHLDDAVSAGDALVPGAAAWLDADLGARDALVVPRDAVVPGSERARVFVDVGDGHFEPRPVTTGAERDGLVEITEGLREGERVATVGAFLLEAESRLLGGAP